MAGTPRDIATLEGWFETGDIPTQQQFYDLFASFIHYLKVQQATGASTTDIMSQKAITDAINAAITGVGEFAGNHDASSGNLPATGTGVAGAIDKGDYWIVSVAGTIAGLGDLDVGDVIFAREAGADVAAEFFYLPFSSSIPDATATVKGIAKLFDTYTPVAARTDGSVSEAVLLSVLYSKKIKVTKSSHGYTVGKVLTLVVGGGYTSNWLATNKHVLAGIVSDVIDVNNFLMVPPGGYIDTLSGLTGGQHYYVQNGDLVIESAVTSNNAQLVLFSLSATSGFVVTDGQNWRRKGVNSHAGNTTFTASGDDRNFHRFHTNPIDLTLNKIYEGFYARGWTEDSKVTLVAGGGITINVHGNGGSLVIPERCFIEFVNIGSFWWVYVFPSQHPVDSTGTAIAFDRPRKYGTIASPITGNLTLDSGGLKPSTVQLIIHNDSAEPTYPTEFKKAAGSGNYVTGVNNFIYAHAVEAGTIIYTITQIP